MFITRRTPLFAPEEGAGGGDPAIEAGSPTPPEGTGTQDPAPSQNWEERYKEAQAWGTRNAQRAAELEAEAKLVQALRSEDPAEYTQALRDLGFNVPDPEFEPEGGLDPEIAAKLAKVDELEQWRNSLTEQEQQQANYASYREMVNPQLSQMGVPEGLHDVVAEAALNLPGIETPQGQKPDLDTAWEQLKEILLLGNQVPEVQSAMKKSWASTKPRAALTSPGGSEGTNVPDLTNRESRQQWMLARLQADRQQ